MIVMNIFQSHCFIEDVIFLAAESIQKKIHGNCELRASLIWINLAGIKWMVGFKTLEYIVDILMFEFCADMS